MASRIAPLLGLLLLAISTISVSHTQSSKAFQRKHITFLDHIDHNQCNSEMRNKRISQTESGCKRLNTFIHAPEQVVDQTCTAGESYVIRNQEYKRSPKKLRITNCRLSQEHGDNCEYMAEASSLRYIVVACDQNGRPVHLERTLTDAAAGKPDDKQPGLNPTTKPSNSASAHWVQGQGSLCMGRFGGLLLFFSFVFCCCL